uniref:uncharacterized protein LOC117611008 n=1 Tax=Osmia lignaria TaxID=473952 RepID=UPI0014792A81|nr:uncharacterized protein LOC117611008 [Osmia lignaria]
MDRARVIDALVEMTTVNGHPFFMVEDSGLRKILNPIIYALRTQHSINVGINRHNIRDFVHYEAQQLKEKIKNEIQGRMLCLKLDSATKLYRSLFGVNIQLCKNGRICLRNLAVKELFLRQTAENLKREVLTVLFDFYISSEQVYSITTNNGRNMIKSITLLGEEVSVADSQGSEEEDIEGILASELNDANEETLENTLLAVAEEWPKVMENVPQVEPAVGIIGQRCAAHTLQLAVWDALGKFHEPIYKAKNVVKKLRSPIAAGVLAGLGRNKSLLHVETRWHSTHDMLTSLLSVQNVCTQVLMEANKNNRGENVVLTESDWITIKEIVTALHPAKVLNKEASVRATYSR